MTEAFLHYIWQYRLFDMNNLKADDGNIIEVLKPGQLNNGAGPDFFNALLKINGTLWAGNIEIHIHSSDWHKHNHHNDPAYDNCILHVVYQLNGTTLRINGTRIPTIEIKDRFSPRLWDNYLQLISTRGWISCQDHIKEIDSSTWNLTINRMISERLNQRSQQILVALNGLNNDWEECFYQHLARNFGFQINAMPFEMLARSLPFKHIKKSIGNISLIEALLFGQAGMLTGSFNEDYPSELQLKYLHLANKISLKNISFSSWKFLRLRPVNFPTIRISQFAALLNKSSSLFDLIIESESLKTLYNFFKIEASEYWKTHYHFHNSSSPLNKKMGYTSINNILINTCIPFIYSWGNYSGNKKLIDRANTFLSQLPAEENHIIRSWNEIGIISKSAVDSQALIQLKTQYCSEKKCISCNIGNRLINVFP